MIEIRTVSSRTDLNRFIAFPNRLFKEVPSYIPPLNSDERKLLGDKNPSLVNCSRELYLAWRDGKVVGRVAAIINRAVNEHWNKKAVRFGWFDFIEDYDVFTALLDKVVDYGRRHGMTEIEGPFGFTDMDKECWVIDNFDARQNSTTLYNPEYYVRFIERAGYDIRCRWQQYKMPASQPVPDKVARLNGLIMEKYHLRLLKFKSRKEVYPYAFKFFRTLNQSFKDLYDFVPYNEAEIAAYIKEYFPFVNMDFVQFVIIDDRIDRQEDTHTEPVGVGAKGSNVLQTVARRLAGTEPRPRDIYGIGTAVDGCDADVQIPGGSKKLEGTHPT